MTLFFANFLLLVGGGLMVAVVATQARQWQSLLGSIRDLAPLAARLDVA